MSCEDGVSGPFLIFSLQSLDRIIMKSVKFCDLNKLVINIQNYLSNKLAFTKLVNQLLVD